MDNKVYMDEYKELLKSFDGNTLQIGLSVLKRFISNIGVVLGLALG